MLAHWNRPAALLTQHGKERLLGPLVAQVTGHDLVHLSHTDTDRFGSFTRETPRLGSQLEAARAKAQEALRHSGLSLALASEGAFVADPWAGLVPWNVEVVLLLDAQHGQEIVGLAQGPGQAGQGLVDSVDGLWRLAQSLGFPAHGLCLRPDHAEHPQVVKGLHAPQALAQAFASALQASEQGQVFVESDLRALANPTRQQMILRAAQDLVQKMHSLCPACQRPGFAAAAHTPGLPCRACGAPTRLPLAQVWVCGVCEHRQSRPVPSDGLADPARCDRCNP